MFDWHLKKKIISSTTQFYYSTSQIYDSVSNNEAKIIKKYNPFISSLNCLKRSNKNSGKTTIPI
jgi:hypothetical protein